jgi:hypothetical protein
MMTMKLRIVILMLALIETIGISGQQSVAYNQVFTAEQNFAVLAGMMPYTPGGMSFDSRYEGVVGTRLVFDTLCPSLFRFKGQEKWIGLMTDLDVVENRLIFAHPSTAAILSVPAEMVGELIVTSGGSELVFRTTQGMKFEKEDETVRFCQVLSGGQYTFIKVPYKNFIEADYKALYSSQRRYDEYESGQRYYVLATDSVFHEVSLRKKSLAGLFPLQNEVLTTAPNKPVPGQSNEEYFAGLIRLLEK